MLKKMLAMALVIGLGTWIISGCNSTVKPLPDTGTVVSFVSDVPFCSVLNLRSEIAGLTLTVAGSTTAVPVFPVGNTMPLYKVSFGGLRDFSTLLDISSVPVGTYDKASITFTVGELALYDPTLSPPIHVTSATFPSSATTFAINPPLVITKGTVSALQMDLDIRQSVQLDQNGQVTGTVTPVMTLSSPAATTNEGFGEMDDMTGFDTMVTTTETNSNFTGGISYETLSGTGSLVTANLTTSTQLCGPATVNGQACTPIPLNQLLTASFIEMDGFVNSSGTLVVNSMDVEDHDDPTVNQLGLVGNVISVNKDAQGNVTQFNFYVREEEPDDEAGVQIDSDVLVNVSSSTVYEADPRYVNPTSTLTVNFANLPVDAKALAPGQELVVHGVFTTSTGNSLPTTVAADKVYLKLQSYEGNFSALLAAQPDGKTGGFWLAPCAAGLFQGTRILVLTNSQTAFVNVIGLSSLTPPPSLLVKGLLFYDTQGGTVNGVSIPPGTAVLEAKQVHQLQ
jgi:hypothetical protein